MKMHPEHSFRGLNETRTSDQLLLNVWRLTDSAFQEVEIEIEIEKKRL